MILRRRKGSRWSGEKVEGHRKCERGPNEAFRTPMELSVYAALTEPSSHAAMTELYSIAYLSSCAATHLTWAESPLSVAPELSQSMF